MNDAIKARVKEFMSHTLQHRPVGEWLAECHTDEVVEERWTLAEWWDFLNKSNEWSSPVHYRLFQAFQDIVLGRDPDWLCGATAALMAAAPPEDDEVPDIGIPFRVPLFNVETPIADLEDAVMALHWQDIGWVCFSIWHQSRYGTRRRVTEGLQSIKAAAAELHFIGSIGGVNNETEEAFGPLAVQKVKDHMVLDSWWVEATFHPF